MPKPAPLANIAPLIVTVRDQRVILDADLAALYGVSTMVLNQAVKRNQERFPRAFLFQLTRSEWLNDLKSQIVISNTRGSHHGARSDSKRKTDFFFEPFLRQWRRQKMKITGISQARKA